MTVEETATGCVGANSYRDFAIQRGYTEIEVLNWCSSAGDWSFIVSKNKRKWRILFQTNNWPRPGFSHVLGDEVYVGTKEEVLDIIFRED